MTSLFSLYERFFFVFSSQESAVLQGKIRPQPERDEKPQKVPITGRSDVKLREKQKDFEQRDYQAQRVLNLSKTVSNIVTSLTASLPSTEALFITSKLKTCTDAFKI